MSKNPYEELEKRWAAMSVAELGAEIRVIKTELDAKASTKSETQKIYDYLTISIVPDRMDDEGIETMKIDGVGRLQVRSDIRCACPAAKREELYEWLRKSGNGALIGETVNSGTLKAFVKEAMKDGSDYPKDLLKVDPYSRATIVQT